MAKSTIRHKLECLLDIIYLKATAYGKLSGGFADSKIEVLRKNKDHYVAKGFVKYGIEDEDGSVEYKEHFHYKMTEEKILGRING